MPLTYLLDLNINLGLTKVSASLTDRDVPEIRSVILDHHQTTVRVSCLLCPKMECKMDSRPPRSKCKQRRLVKRLRGCKRAFHKYIDGFCTKGYYHDFKSTRIFETDLSKNPLLGSIMSP